MNPGAIHQDQRYEGRSTFSMQGKRKKMMRPECIEFGYTCGSFEKDGQHRIVVKRADLP